MTRTYRWLLTGSSCFLIVVGTLVGCGGDDSCDPVGQKGCDNGLVCELVENGDPACFAPVEVRGEVFDLATDAAIEGANVVALDVNGAAVSTVAVSDKAGNYALAVPSTRRADGTPIPVEITLRADAAGYLTFPSGVRQALPVDTSIAAPDGDNLVVRSALTDLGLLDLPDGAGDSSISGSVELPKDRTGILVVATATDGTGFAGIANRDGEYRIFNIPAGSYTVTAYAKGSSYEQATIDLQAASEGKADLALTDVATGTVSGTIQIVNAPGGSLTSVILVVESTFDETLARGQSVPGLRAPEGGVAPSISSAYTIEGVPAGRYVVLAAFENDNLVRDPDLSIGGTSILHIEVMPGATTTVDGFKVTEALAIIGPGATDPEAVSGPVTFRWKDDSSEDQYVVEVFDAFGESIWQEMLPGASGRDPTLDYAGPALMPGMYYQFRVTSSKDGTPIARTEDLAGVFYLP